MQEVQFRAQRNLILEHRQRNVEEGIEEEPPPDYVQVTGRFTNRATLT
jgi:hypothetical protein